MIKIEEVPELPKHAISVHGSCLGRGDDSYYVAANGSKVSIYKNIDLKALEGQGGTSEILPKGFTLIYTKTGGKSKKLIDIELYDLNSKKVPIPFEDIKDIIEDPLHPQQYEIDLLNLKTQGNYSWLLKLEETFMQGGGVG